MIFLPLILPVSIVGDNTEHSTASPNVILESSTNSGMYYLSDLSISPENIIFSSSNPQVNETVEINATIYYTDALQVVSVNTKNRVISLGYDYRDSGSKDCDSRILSIIDDNIEYKTPFNIVILASGDRDYISKIKYMRRTHPDIKFEILIGTNHIKLASEYEKIGIPIVRLTSNQLNLESYLTANHIKYLMFNSDGEKILKITRIERPIFQSIVSKFKSFIKSYTYTASAKILKLIL